jgi:hypothetical protein
MSTKKGKKKEKGEKNKEERVYDKKKINEGARKKQKCQPRTTVV